MHNRRSFLLSSASLMLATPLWAQHADLEPTDDAGTAPTRRRFLMEDSYGNVITDEDLGGRFFLVYFGYTGCPDVCPTTLSTIADALDLLTEEERKGLSTLFVTVDPDRDTAKLMREYVGFFHKDIIALRGPKPYTDHMVKAYNARYEVHVPDPAHPDRYSIDHTASTAFMGPDGALIKRFPHGTSAEAMAEDIRATMAQAVLQ